MYAKKRVNHEVKVYLSAKHPQRMCTHLFLMGEILGEGIHQEYYQQVAQPRHGRQAQNQQAANAHPHPVTKIRPPAEYRGRAKPRLLVSYKT